MRWSLRRRLDRSLTAANIVSMAHILFLVLFIDNAAFDSASVRLRSLTSAGLR